MLAPLVVPPCSIERLPAGSNSLSARRYTREVEYAAREAIKDWLSSRPAAGSNHYSDGLRR